MLRDQAPDGNVLKAGLVGCGGRGTGAAMNFLNAGPNLEITALGDLYPHRLESYRATLLERQGAAGGYSELSINGERAGDHMLDPAKTRYDGRLIYVTHDVTSMIRNGENTIGVILGNGWYNHQSTAVWFFHEAPWRSRPSFCADLRITYADGTVETISTGRDWRTSPGPIIFNSIYTGEHYDTRLEQEGWDTPGFDYSGWFGVRYVPSPSQNIVAQAISTI